MQRALLIASVLAGALAVPGVASARKWLWIHGEGGWEAVDLQTFEANEDELTAGFVPTRASSPAAGLGLGLNLLPFTIGARGRVAAFRDSSSQQTVDGWQLWTFDAELGLRVPLFLSPYATLAGGYATFGSLSDAVRGMKEGLDVDGANLRVGVGLDIPAGRTLSIGILATAEALFLARSGVSVRSLAEPKEVGTVSEAQARVLEADGSSVGGALTLTAGLRFDL